MRTRINNSSSYYSTHSSSESRNTRSSTSSSARSAQTSGHLSHLASRLSAAGEAHHATRSARYEHSYAPAPAAIYNSEHGSVVSSLYESATSVSLPPEMSDTGSSHSGSNHLFEIDLNRSARRSEAGSDLFEIDLHGAGRSFAAGDQRRSETAMSLSQASTPTERSFHLSERGDVASALHNRRLGYSSASSRRLTSYEGSTLAGSVAANSAAGSAVSGYHGGRSPSDSSVARRAMELGRGRLVCPDLPRSEGSLDSEYSAYLREGDDVVAPLRPSKFTTISSTKPSDPYSVISGSASRRLSRAPSFSGRLGDNHRPSVDSDWSSGGSYRSSSDSGRMSQFGGADLHSLADAGAGPSSAPPRRQLWQLLQENH